MGTKSLEVERRKIDLEKFFESWRFYDEQMNSYSWSDLKREQSGLSGRNLVKWALARGMVPSVTTVLSMTTPPWILSWRMSDSVSSSSLSLAFGSQVHKDIALWLTKQEKGPSWEYIVPLALWLKRNIKSVILCEKCLFSKNLKFAGTCDLLFLDNNNCVNLIDFKTVKSNGTLSHSMVYENWKLQLAAYSILIEETNSIVPQNHTSMLISNPFGSSKEPQFLSVNYNQNQIQKWKKLFLYSLEIWHFHFED